MWTKHVKHYVTSRRAQHGLLQQEFQYYLNELICKKIFVEKSDTTNV